MTLSGRIAEEHPDVDGLAPTVAIVVAHTLVPVNKRGRIARRTAAADATGVTGHVNPTTGVWRARANAMNEKTRRELGLRRNGQPQQR